MFHTFFAYVDSLAIKHSVNVGVFFSLYVVACLFCVYFLSVFLYRSKRKLPLIGVSLAFSISWILPYLYVAVFGQNVPVWVYVIVIAILLVGVRQLVVLYQHKHPKQ